MTLYAGELVKVVHTAKKDNVALVPADITAVHITIHQNATVVVAETNMTWDSVKLRWQYLWDTSGRTTGTYKARVRIEGVDGGSVWEWKRIRLAANPA